jgi:hypothetical protein
VEESIKKDSVQVKLKGQGCGSRAGFASQSRGNRRIFMGGYFLDDAVLSYFSEGAISLGGHVRKT